jgi:wyosine [tRNA(Phe)-imidazoG37] synthetase (radical SAM superfamily)
VEDFLEVYEKEHIDVITYSGSGEPTLASNLRQMIEQIRSIAPHINQGILTNGTELYRSEVQQALAQLDQVTIKLDSLDPEIFQKINRPEKSVKLESIVESIIHFKKSVDKPIFIQTMFMPINSKQLDQFAKTIELIQPTELQLNTPKRPYPLSWHRENRGNHLMIFDYEVRELATLDPAQAEKLESELKSKIQTPISSIYH